MTIYKGFNSYHYIPDVYEIDAERRNGTSCLPEQHMGWRWGLVWLVCVGASVMFCLAAV